MKFFYFFIFLFLFSNVSKAKDKKLFYKEEYIYKVKYFNINIGEIKLNLYGKNKKKSSFSMKLDTKKNLAWMYSLNQSVVATFDNNFSQLTEWKSNRKKKSVHTYAHIRLSSSLAKPKQIKLIHLDKKKKIINKYLFLLKKNKNIHSAWTAPWYIASLSWKKKQKQTINLLYKKKIVVAEINLLNQEDSLVLNKKIKTQVFSISAVKDKSLFLKVWISQHKKNTIVSSFNLKLKTGQLNANLKSYKKELL